MTDNERWDLHEVPTHFDTEDRWILDHFTTGDGVFAIIEGMLAYLLYSSLPHLGYLPIREQRIEINFLVAAGFWVVMVLFTIIRWNGEQAWKKVWRRLYFRARPSRTVWRPRATDTDRELLKAAARSARDEEEEE